MRRNDAVRGAVAMLIFFAVAWIFGLLNSEPRVAPVAPAPTVTPAPVAPAPTSTAIPGFWGNGFDLFCAENPKSPKCREWCKQRDCRE